MSEKLIKFGDLAYYDIQDKRLKTKTTEKEQRRMTKENTQKILDTLRRVREVRQDSSIFFRPSRTM